MVHVLMRYDIASRIFRDFLMISQPSFCFHASAFANCQALPWRRPIKLLARWVFKRAAAALSGFLADGRFKRVCLRHTINVVCCYSPCRASARFRKLEKPLVNEQIRCPPSNPLTRPDAATSKRRSGRMSAEESVLRSDFLDGRS